MRYLLISTLSLLLLAGCATGPRYETTGVATNLVPSEVSASTRDYQGSQVIWGGMIVATRNLADHTELEVLGYPLENNQRPAASRTPQGRFLVRTPGYLEEVSYAPGRRITVTGTLGEKVQGQVGEAPYTYPLVHARDTHLWPVESRSTDSGSNTRFSIGVGVIFR